MCEQPTEAWELFYWSLDQLPLHIAVVDSAGKIIYANPGAKDFAGLCGIHDTYVDFRDIICTANPEWLADEILVKARTTGWSGDVAVAVCDDAPRWVHIQACKTPPYIPLKDAVILVFEDTTGSMELVNTLLKRSEELFSRNRELEVACRVSRMMVDQCDNETRLRAILEEATKIVGVHLTALFVKSRDGNTMSCQCFYGDDPTHLLGRTIPTNAQSFTAGVISTGKTQMTSDISKCPLAIKEYVSVYGMKSALGVPVILNGEPIGAMMMGDKEKHRIFSAEEVMLSETIANIAASSIQSARLSEKVEESYAQVMRASRWASVGELLAGAAHNFGNVLMGIQCSLDLLRSAVTSSVPASEISAKFEIALKQVRRGSELVNRLMEFSRGSELLITSVNIDEVVEAALSLSRNHPASRHTRVLNCIPANTPKVRAHGSSLEEVILNLIINAFQATEKGGVVALDAVGSEDGTMLDLRISDNGCGMDEETQQRIFEPFYSTKGSTGLGLPTCLAIINRMGGRLTVASSPGEGSVFTISLGTVREESSSDTSLAA